MENKRSSVKKYKCVRRWRSMSDHHAFVDEEVWVRSSVKKYKCVRWWRSMSDHHAFVDEEVWVRLSVKKYKWISPWSDSTAAALSTLLLAALCCSLRRTTLRCTTLALLDALGLLLTAALLLAFCFIFLTLPL